MNFRHLATAALIATAAWGMSAAADNQPIESNTIPTAQMLADFLVTANYGSTQAHVVAILFQQVTDNQGNTTFNVLNLSSNETVTFTGAGQTVTYDPKNDNQNVIAYNSGETYSVTFTRYNGETYTSKATIPALPMITSPAQDLMYKKTDAVTINWNTVTAQGGGAFLLSLFDQNEGQGCNTQGEFQANAGTATIPANWVATCKFAVSEYFSPFYENQGAQMGALNGAITTQAVDLLHYTYAAGTRVPLRTATIPTAVWKAFIASRQTAILGVTVPYTLRNSTSAMITHYGH